MIRGSAATLCLVVLVSGCSEPDAAPDTSNAPFVEVIYDKNPLADVQVRLHDSATGDPIATATSGAAGKAYFTNLPSPEPQKYFISMESFGDGGWILDPKLAQPKTSPLSANPLVDNPRQKIELPAKSVRPL